MSSRSLQLSENVYDYLLSNSLREKPAFQRLREETSTMTGGGMQISPEQGQLMGLLVELIGARRAIEVGTFTGYSAMSVAKALPADGQLIACDVSEEWTSVGRKYWEEAGVSAKIDLRLAPAADTLRSLLDEGQGSSFDFAFIDADKVNYESYYELVLELLRPGGLLLVDNVLWGGKVADPTVTDEATDAIRKLNRRVHEDDRVTMSMLPIGDGLTLVRKR